MNKPSIRSVSPAAAIFSLLVSLLSVSSVSAVTVTWNGPATTNTTALWSGANWTPGVPGIADDVKFYDIGATPGVSNINNTVDATFGGTIGSLQYGNTNNTHTTLIANGVTLNVTAAGLTVGTPTDVGAARNLTNTITGVGGALVINNATTNISINQVGATTGNRANLDLSGLGNFTVNAYRMGIGDGQFPGVAVNNKAGGNLILAKTNNITLAYSDTLANYQTAGKNSAITVSRNSGNNPGIVSILQLGINNTFNVDSMNFGMDKSGNNTTAAHGIMQFNSAFAGQNPVANFYGLGGPGTRVTWWSIGDGNQSASSSNGGGGTNDFSLGTVNAFVNVMSLARDASSASDTWAGPHKGVFSFTNGTVDVNTLIIGNQSLETGTSTTASLGIFNVGGGGALLKVNSLLTLGFTTLATAAGTGTSGNLNVNGGTVYANNIAVGASSSANNIRLVNGTLVVTNTIATNALSLNFGMTNSILGLSVPANGSLRVLTKSLLTGGATNLILLDSKPVFFASYPQQFPLIKYTTWTGTNNFGLTNVPAWAVGATLVSNGPNSSLDLSLPSDPRPVITAQPTAYSGNPGDNVTTSFAVTIAPASVTPLGYQWYYTNGVSTNALANGPGPSGLSTLSGSTTTNLQIANAQPGDNGGYFVVVTNAFGTNTSSRVLLTISAGAIAPTASGPASQTATNTITTTIVDSTSGSPVPTLFWYFNGTPLTDGTGPSGSSTISGSSSSTLTISNPQYPGDQGTYSMVASNSAGMATNNTVLTVIVPPVITSQPVSSVVTNTQSASFTVAATGVPAPTFQWSKNGTPISSGVNNTATNATFSIASVSASDASTNYSVTVSNPAGVTNSVQVSLIVNSIMTTTILSPANGATGICYDTPLYVTFSQKVLARNAGKIKIYNVTNSATPVDTLDMSLNSTITQVGTGIPSYPVNVQPRTIAGASYVTFPVIITSNTAAIYPHGGVMTSNQTYYVTIDNGVFTDTNGAYFVGITATNTWQFTTKPAGPLANTNYVAVSPDGTADFCTIQGAVDFMPNFTNTTSFNRVIFLRKGNCVEIVNVPVGKNNITIRGESRQESLLSYPNSNLINPSSHTVMVLHVRANDIAIDNLKLTNSVPQGGSQSFALMVETGAKRFICNNTDVDSYQDTILVNTSDNTAYFYKSLVQGDVDFIWGGGNCFFTNCELRELRTGGIYFQPRAPAGSNGISVVRCALTRLNGTNASGSNFTNCLFARALGNTNSSVALIYCNIDTNVVQTGWTASEIADQGLALRWWEYGNSNLDGTLPVAYNGIQLTGSDPRLLAAQNATIWLNGWVPQLAPNILTNPVSQTVNYGSSAVFTVTATGIPDPTYQWIKDGTNFSGATTATLNIGSATSDNAGSYSVVVTTTAGSVTSSPPAMLTVNPPANTAPVFTAPLAGTNIAINVGVNLSVACTATDSDTPAQTLIYSLLTGPSGATINTNSGVLTWRPTVAQANSSNPVKVAVTDNGTPNLSATNSFSISVNPLTQPNVAPAAYAAGQFTLSVSGQVGPDYIVQVSTNLAGGFWSTLYTTNPAAMPFSFTDPNGALPVQFYRILVGP